MWRSLDHDAHEVAAQQGILSLRLHIFYLGTVRYMNEALDHAQDGDDGALTAINQTASDLLLTQDDLVISFE